MCKELFNLLPYGHPECNLITTYVIIELTFGYIKSTGRSKKKQQFQQYFPLLTIAIPDFLLLEIQHK